MSTSTLSAAASDRKARLAQLKTLKRKQPADDAPPDPSTTEDPSTSPRPAKSPRRSPPPPSTDAAADDEPISTSILSGRNYDPLTRGPRLGFETNPSLSSRAPTAESRAQALSSEVQAQLAAEKSAAKEGRDEAPLDLFKLRPKKPNWDLKRDLEERMRAVDVRTENAIARLVRERIAAQKGRGKGAGDGGEKVEGGAGEHGVANGDADGEEVGMEGNVLVEATKEREREMEEDARREREAEAELEVP